jgi:hypothetical protein
MQHRQRMRLALGDRVAADDAVETRAEAICSSSGSVSQAALLVTMPARKPRSASESSTGSMPGKKRVPLLKSAR